jgi:hypothetical protein
VVPIECKSALTVKNSHLGGVRDFMDRHRAPIAIVAALAPLERRTLSRNRTVLILPLYLIERWPDFL